MFWFEVFLVSLTVGSGLIVLFDRMAARRRTAQATPPDQSVLSEHAHALFPVMLAVLILRSFIAEPSHIPSNSMMPTLLSGDFVLLNKFAYGFRLPITNTKVVSIGEPVRGDVVVFHPPHHPDQDWVKRVIGLPGDRVGYHGKQLSINGQPVSYKDVGIYQGYARGDEMTGATELSEALPGRPHPVLEMRDRRFITASEGDWTVPPDHYFMMGDNRDDSEDSRFWPTHFLPESGIRGKASVILFNVDGHLDFTRSGRIR